MSNKKAIQLFGYASGVAAASQGAANGPLLLARSPFLQALQQEGVQLHWHTIIKQEENSQLSKLEQVTNLCQQLATALLPTIRSHAFFTVFGGDHSSAIGTWSAVAHAKRAEGPLGLIWIDAHMDSHTPSTSETGNIHGMPVATLLGYGDKHLTELLDSDAKILPENLCLIGIRSFEHGEEALLKRLNVKVFYVEEVHARGLSAVFSEAQAWVTRHTSQYGISIDIDSMDPVDAPGTGVAEPNGIAAQALCQVLTQVADDARCIGMEIVEFDPSRDQNQKTERLIPRLVAAVSLGKEMA